jgi:hypothetical protein
MYIFKIYVQLLTVQAVYVYEICRSLKMAIPCGRNTQEQWIINILQQTGSEGLYVE